MKRGGRLAPVSKKRLAERAAYEDAKTAVEYRDRGECQAERSWPEVKCWGRRDPHHIAPTGRYPERRADPDNMTTLCRGHHDAVHQVDPVRARALGLLV